MNVLLYSHTFAPNVGGVETLTGLLAHGLSDRVRLTVATRTSAASGADARLPFRVVRRPSLRALWALVREADVVHLAGPALGPLVLARLLGRPVVVEHHAYQAACPNGLLFLEPDQVPCPGHFLARRYGRCVHCRAASLGWLAGVRSVALTFLRRRLTRAVRANVAVSRHVARRLELGDVLTIYHGVAPTAVAAAPVPELPAPPCFAFVGRLVREKGVHVLLAAAAELSAEGRPVRVRIVGDGPQRRELERLAAALGVTAIVEFMGVCQGAAMDQALAGMHVLVMPSIWEETAGFSAIEALWQGRPVIAADIGGLAEIVAEGGLAVPAGDPAALAAAMRRFYDEPGLASRLAARGRARAEARFQLGDMLDAHGALWSSVSR